MADPLRSDRRLAHGCLVAAWALAATVAGCGSDQSSPPAETSSPAAAAPATDAPTAAEVAAPPPAAAVTQASWAPDALEEVLAPIALYPDGYLHRVLLSQGPAANGGARDYVVDGKLSGGYALIAWPADYGSSGIMTFMVNQEGIVWQRDLGEDTDKAVEDITQFNPDEAWTPIAIEADEEVVEEEAVAMD